MFISPDYPAWPETGELQGSALNKHAVVLVVEDDAFIRMDVADFLSSVDIEAVEAENADQAFALLRQRDDIDVLFTDVNMPGSMDGLALADKAHRLHPDMGIIVASGMVRPSRSDIPDEAKFLAKPYDLHHVRRCIEHMRHAC